MCSCVEHVHMQIYPHKHAHTDAYAYTNAHTYIYIICAFIFLYIYFIFQLCVLENYRNNPFHNFRHCFCVAQMMYGMIHLCGLSQYMPLEDIGILLTAAVCHDLDHPGYNNT